MISTSPERRDGKLESFLHKALPSEDYERLLVRQAVVLRLVVVTTGRPGKPAHRHAVLGHRRLYLTDVPPRNMRMEIDLRYVESVQMLEEPAEFLKGKERDEAVHLQLVFTREVKQEKGLLSSLGDISPALTRHRSPSNSASKISGITSSSPIPGRHSMPLPDHVTQDSVKKCSSCHSLTQLGQQQKIVLSFSPQLTPKSRIKGGGISTPSPLSVHGVSFSSSTVSTTDKKIETSKLIQSSVPASSLSPEDRKRWLMERSLKPSPDTLFSTDTSSPQPRAKLSLSPSDDPLYTSHSSPSLLSSSPSLSSLSSGGRRKSPGSLSTSRLNLSARDSSSSLDFSSKDSVSEQGETKREKCILHLYLLSPNNTDFYQHLTTTWLNQMIAVTLATNLPSYSPSTVTSKPSDHFSHHYGSLKQEILQSRTTRASTPLLQELWSACQKYYIIKRLFWESSDLLDHLIRILQHRLTGGPPSEPEYLVVVLQLLYEMMRESHSLQRRCTTLTEDSGRRLHTLITVLVHLSTSLPKLVTVGDINSEIVEKTCCILSELMKYSQQMRWPGAAKVGVVSLEWTLDIINHHTNIREFCGVVVEYESALLHHHHSLQYQHYVCLYHTSHLLHCLAVHSLPLLHLLHSHFSEEFRYLLSVSKAKDKLPTNSPLSLQTLSYLKHTKSKVLQHNQ